MTADLGPAWRRLPWLIAYAVAMAYVEAAVVVYLRAIYYPRGFAFPLAPMPPGMAAIEIGREAATLVMLLGVAMLAGNTRVERFLAFASTSASGISSTTCGCGCCSGGQPRCSPGTSCSSSRSPGLARSSPRSS